MAPIVTVLLLAGVHLISAQSSFDRKYISPAIIHGDGSLNRCPSEQLRASSRQELKESVANTLQPPSTHPCGAGMWTRIAYLNMTDPLQSCPSAWRQSTTNGVRVCGRPLTSNDMCHGVFYSNGGRTFTKVCGRVIGYQSGEPDAFHTSDSINDAYVEGVSITHGSPRLHIWTYAADYSETSSSTACPCDTSSTNSPPSFVGSNYYCESGNPDTTATDGFLYASDPLWDGKQCSSEGTCCSNGQTPPWFSVMLNNTISDNIEVRICANFRQDEEDTPIELLEIYIQ